MRKTDFHFKWFLLIAVLLLASFFINAGSPLSVIADEKKSKGDSYIGILMQELTKDLLEGLDTSVKKGVLVSGVMEDSPAEKAGLKEGDIIVEFDGTKVSSPKELKEIVVVKDVGDEIKVKVIRDDKTRVLDLVVGERPEEEDWSFHLDIPRDLGSKIRDSVVYAFKPTGRLGVEVRDLDEKLGYYFKVGEGEGVLVVEVYQDTPAEEAGIEAGDVILMVAEDEISSVDELKDVVKELKEGEEVEVTVKRHGRKKTFTAKMKEYDLDREKHFIIRGSRPDRDIYIQKDHGDYDVENFDFDKEAFRKEMDALKKEIKELKKELKKLKKE
jgi:C-terminal processing protease CtpA/Prc